MVLQIAHRLRDRLQDMEIKGNPVRVVMTRDADFFVPLSVRVAKARAVSADLLLSIHADAFVQPQARGASVFAGGIGCPREGGAASATAAASAPSAAPAMRV